MNNPTPAPTPLERYKTALDCLDNSNITLNKEQILEILSARDSLQKQLESETEIPVNMWEELIKQDIRLKEKTYKIIEDFDLAKYRETRPISDQAWWWHLESRESLHPFNRFDWLFRVGKLLLLGVNFTLIGTIATRFLGGGSGFIEIGAVIFSTFISLLQTQNALTQAREKGFVKLMKLVKIKEHWYEEVQFFTTAIVFIILLIISFNFPLFSDIYKQQGKTLQSPEYSQKLPQLDSAEEKYLKAIELNPDNLDAHYKLATLYEELQDINQAKKHYLIAAKGGLLEAYNNLAYWYIREGKDAEAVELLETGIKFLAKKDENLEQLSEDEKKELSILRYSLHKNLGWARVKQERYQDAIPHLLIAMGIVNQPDYKDYIRGSGAVYCLYAQVLEKTAKNSPQLQENWRKCEALISERKAAGETINSEEDKWLYEAREKLQ